MTGDELKTFTHKHIVKVVDFSHVSETEIRPLKLSSLVVDSGVMVCICHLNVCTVVVIINCALLFCGSRMRITSVYVNIRPLFLVFMISLKTPNKVRHESGCRSQTMNIGRVTEKSRAVSCQPQFRPFSWS
jgi:hypothetical protein